MFVVAYSKNVDGSSMICSNYLSLILNNASIW